MSDTLQRSIGIWGDETFGHHHDKAGCSQGIYKHMDKEFTELADEMDKVIVQSFEGKLSISECHTDKVAEECADIFILMCSLAHIYGFSIDEAVRCKMAINRSREWGEADSDGVVEHIRNITTSEGANETR